MRFVLVRIPLIALSVLASSMALSKAMMEPYRESLIIEYANGDTLEISCKNNATKCLLRLQVNGEEFIYDPAALGASITPRHAILYSGHHSGRSEYFSFQITVECPDSEETQMYRCIARALVDDGQIGHVSIDREDF